MILQGEHIKLRALEPEDLAFLYEIENNPSFWEFSHTQAPFSKYLLKQYIQNAHLDIYETKQLRLMIENSESKTIGMIDLFDFNPQHHNAGIGILIHPEYQGNGYADNTLTLLIKYAFNQLNLHQVYVNIAADNTKSISLFKKHNFELVGVKKDWIYINGLYKNELLFQLING